MQALNSVGDTRKALSVTGLGMLVAFLFLVPLAAFAASSTVTVNATYTAATNQVAVSGTVTPAPGVSGTNVAVEITSPTGVVVDANQFAVNSGTGAYSGTFVTGGPSYSVNGSYTVSANYNGGAASATFQYGTTATTTPASGTTTTVFFTTTVVNNIQTTVTLSGGQTTVTQVQQGGSTTVTSIIQQQTTVTQSYTGSDTGTYVGIVGIIIAIIAIVLAVMTMRKK